MFEPDIDLNEFSDKELEELEAEREERLLELLDVVKEFLVTVQEHILIRDERERRQDKEKGKHPH